jgi:histidinol-phosphate aminotransferase
MVNEALCAADTAKLRLYPDGDSGFLRGAIAAEINVSDKKIFCANSSDEVLALAFQAFFSGKKNIITPDISYGFYPVWGEMYDTELEFAALREDFTIDTENYKNSNGVIIANPNAPTSLALGLCEIEKILKQNPRGVVIIDEAYIDFAREESALKLTDSYENLLVVRTFSKSHSLAGLRVGYAVGSSALIDGLRRVRDAFNSYPLDMLAQICAAAAISDTEYLKKTTAQIIKTRGFTIRELKKLGYNVLDSQANFIFMQTENAETLYKFLLENKILARYWKKTRIEKFLRVSIGTDEDMEAFIKCVSRF